VPDAIQQISRDCIRVLIVDDRAAVRRGLSFFLLAFDDLELVGEATNGEQALILCAQTQPDVVLMDLLVPGMDAASATRTIRQRFPQIQIIALTSFWAEELVGGVLEAGASSYLLKNVSAEELADAIRAAHAGQPPQAPEVTQDLSNGVTQPSAPGQDLTPREREVLALMVEGLKDAEIAERLVIGLSTAKFHVRNVFSKLGVTSRAEAVALASQHQLLPGAGKEQEGNRFSEDDAVVGVQSALHLPGNTTWSRDRGKNRTPDQGKNQTSDQAAISPNAGCIGGDSVVS
jgi:NarL family two-component system response regulator LiaR